MDWPSIQGGYLIFDWGSSGIGVPLWFIGVVLLIFIALATVTIFVIASFAKKPRR